MKNLLCFLIPIFTFAAIIADFGQPYPTATDSTASDVVLLSDVERSHATHQLTRHH